MTEKEQAVILLRAAIKEHIPDEGKELGAVSYSYLCGQIDALSVLDIISDDQYNEFHETVVRLYRRGRRNAGQPILNVDAVVNGCNSYDGEIAVEYDSLTREVWAVTLTSKHHFASHVLPWVHTILVKDPLVKTPETSPVTALGIVKICDATDRAYSHEIADWTRALSE